LHPSKEIDGHCQQAIVDQHRWLKTFAGHCWVMPHVHGNLLQSVNDGDLPSEGDFKSRFDKISKLPLSKTMHCFTHGTECRVDTPDHAGEVNFSGLPCEENSRCNAQRQFLNGRFANLYGCWARRHKVLRTPLLILENTPDPQYALVFFYQLNWFPIKIQYGSKQLKTAQISSNNSIARNITFSGLINQPHFFAARLN
jgi:hypothetical protein